MTIGHQSLPYLIGYKDANVEASIYFDIARSIINSFLQVPGVGQSSDAGQHVTLPVLYWLHVFPLYI